MPGNRRAAPAFDNIVEKGTTIERRVVNATAMMEVACFDRMYEAPESESAELRTIALLGDPPSPTPAKSPDWIRCLSAEPAPTGWRRVG
jgi:hypothetical protein